MKKTALFVFGLAILMASCVPSKQYQELKAKQEACEEERQGLLNDNRNLNADNSEMEAEIGTLKRRLEGMKEDTTMIGRRYRDAMAQYDRINDLNEQLLEKQSALRQQGTEENRKLLETLQETQLDLQRREDELRKLEAELNKKKRNLDELSAALEAREARVKELEEIIAEKDRAVAELKDRIAAALLGFKDKGLTVEQKNGKIYVSLEAKLLFPSGSTVVNEEGKKALVDLANVIKDEEDITIMVEGHTDTDPFNGSGAVKDNWDLSVMRATSVVRIMTEQGNVSPTMLTAAGRGEHVPVAPNDTAEGKAKNRRIEIILTPNLDKLFEIISE